MSPEQILLLLDKLLEENLHGPILQLPRNSRVSPTSSVDSPVQEQDLDSFDPRWKTLFVENFIENLGESNDDLLFFVIGDMKLMPVDSIIVKRKVPNAGLPVLPKEVDWKKTFYLNLISQTSCYLTVAICQKQENTELAPNGNLINDDHDQKKQKMIANNRVVKKVFSAPYKSRMDVKDALMNECSYPLVYYTVNDFESSSVQLEISQNEYLCVELCILLPQKLGLNSDFTSMTRPQSPNDKSNLNDVDDLSPFPTPPDTRKIVLFQGAVPFVSLADVYAQKSLAAQNSVKLSWSKLNSSPEAVKIKKTEYIMMRGPRGKGQCQVAINSQPSEEEKKNSGLLRKLAGVASKVLGSDRIKSEEALSGLVVSITYVNVAWQSIVNDLLEFAKETKSSRS
jgi:hypothetical protein